jgi:hypothetical protein
LKGAIERLRERLQTLSDQLREAHAAEIHARSARWWKELGALRGEAAPLFAECFAYALGPLTRGLLWPGEPLDGGLCSIADEMLEELTVPVDRVWSRRTVLSASEFMGDPVQIIRLRFPVTAIWDLPVAAHEFGHLVGLGPHIAPAIQCLANGETELNWLHEHFADVFATWTLGPAFARTCLLTRFDPGGDPNLSSDTHPSDGLRSYAILRTLEAMDREKGSSDLELSSIAGQLAQAWDECRAAAAPRAISIDRPHRSRLDRWLTELLASVKVACSGEVYSRPADADDLAQQLRSKAGLPDDINIINILNAAWEARVSLCETAFQIGEVRRAAMAWCRGLIERLSSGRREP